MREMFLVDSSVFMSVTLPSTNCVFLFTLIMRIDLIIIVIIVIIIFFYGNYYCYYLLLLFYDLV